MCTVRSQSVLYCIAVCEYSLFNLFDTMNIFLLLKVKSHCDLKVAIFCHTVSSCEHSVLNHGPVVGPWLNEDHERTYFKCRSFPRPHDVLEVNINLTRICS